jgi:hypothetical protein
MATHMITHNTGTLIKKIIIKERFSTSKLPAKHL